MRLIDADELRSHAQPLFWHGTVVSVVDVYDIDHAPTIDAKPIKPRESQKKLPCVCGCKKREWWCDGTYGGEFFKCIKCGRQSPPGKTRKEAIRNWNRMVSENGETG